MIRRTTLMPTNITLPSTKVINDKSKQYKTQLDTALNNAYKLYKINKTLKNTEINTLRKEIKDIIKNIYEFPFPTPPEYKHLLEPYRHKLLHNVLSVIYKWTFKHMEFMEYVRQNIVKTQKEPVLVNIPYTTKPVDQTNFKRNLREANLWLYSFINSYIPLKLRPSLDNVYNEILREYSKEKKIPRLFTRKSTVKTNKSAWSRFLPSLW